MYVLEPFLTLLYRNHRARGRVWFKANPIILHDAKIRTLLIKINTDWKLFIYNYCIATYNIIIMKYNIM